MDYHTVPERERNTHVANRGIPFVRIRFHNRFICVGVDISIYALLTGGRS